MWLAVRQAAARWSRWLVVVALGVGLAVAGYLTLWTFRLLRALVLPGNLLLELHLVESAFLMVLGLDLLVRLLRLRRGAAPVLELPDGSRVTVSRPVVIGREPGPWGVGLDAVTVSARHLEVRRAGDALEVRDLGSSNGSFLRGRDLRETGPALLHAGERVELGLAGPALGAVRPPLRGLLRPWLFEAMVMALGAIGLFLGWRSNLAALPPAPAVLPGGGAGFAPFRSPLPVAAVAAALAGLLFLWTAGLRRRRTPALTVVGQALQLLLVVGLVTLYPLMPREGLRYARAVSGRVTAGQVAAPAAPDAKAAPGQAGKLGAPDATTLRLAGLARSLAAPEDASPLRTTYFRQALGALLAVALLLVLPLWWPWLRKLEGRLVAYLSRPVLPGTSGGGLGIAAHWDVVVGMAAGGLVMLVLLTPLGTSLGHGQQLWLKTPLGTVQSIEVAKALFVLFMAGYFGRLGRLMELVPRTRYLGPFVVASSLVLLATAAQADMGGLLMLGLLVALLFVLATGVSRLVLAVPILLAAGVGLAALLGRTGMLATRLGLWLDPVHHLRGEQVVAGRQLLMSSRWTGHTPARSLAWRIPDIHGDLSFAALGERFGLIGVLGFLAAWAALVAGLLLLARGQQRRGSEIASLLVGGTAVLLLLQVLTQAGGVLGLMPFTGVPVPWLSQGLTATVVFTALLGLALAGVDREERGPEAVNGLSTRRVRNGERLGLAALLAVACLASWWLVVLPASGRFGPSGRDYRWVDPERAAEVQGLLEDGVFVQRGSSGVRLDVEAWRRHLESFPDDAGLDLTRFLEGLRVEHGTIRARAWLVSGANPYALRPLPRGWILGAEGSVLAMNDRRGRRVQPLGRAASHLVGTPGGRWAGWGLEARLGPVLEGARLSRVARMRAFAADVHHGPDLRLTVLPALQRKAHKLLGGRPGAAVVMTVEDGALLAVVSSPAPKPGTHKLSVLELPDRAVGFAHPYTPPGSTFKMVLAAAALTNRPVFSAGRKVLCRGYDRELDVRCAHGASHGRIGLARALTVSCNIYFGNLAVELGGDAIREAAERFGFNPGKPVNLLAGVDGASWPVAPSAVKPEAVRNERELARLGFGQGPVNATPLQMARVGAAIASGGLLPSPHLLRSVELASSEGRDRRVVWQEKIRPPRPVRVLPKLVAAQLNHDLRAVFEDPRGTAHALPALWHGPEGWMLWQRAPGEGWRRVPVAGKTGSAWRTRRSRRDDAWMVAWAPADHARVVVCVLVDDAGTGARAAGPVAMELLRSSLAALEGRDG